MDYDSLAKAGSMLGSGSVIILDETTDMPALLERISLFYYRESCGQCTPCREGTAWMFKIIDRIRKGHGRIEDLNILEEVGNQIGTMPGTTICGLADGAGWPVKNAIRKYRNEFESYIKNGDKKVRTLNLQMSHH
jgi:NADH-quinone oxidoreductase subunit F